MFLFDGKRFSCCQFVVDSCKRQTFVLPLNQQNFRHAVRAAVEDESGLHRGEGRTLRPTGPFHGFPGEMLPPFGEYICFARVGGKRENEADFVGVLILNEGADGNTSQTPAFLFVDDGTFSGDQVVRYLVDDAY